MRSRDFLFPVSGLYASFRQVLLFYLVYLYSAPGGYSEMLASQVQIIVFVVSSGLLTEGVVIVL